ncbi:unnamed protein product [marine sediment metagenome]|uniref:Uncharacterized protein n=1 Tax=marine sediment metagenome TaxID=412755 RepID=X0VF30_9ZZZZ
MKIRKGFVSNSSSSSFVVAFPEKPTDIVHVKRMMFGADKKFPNPYPGLRDGCPEEYDTMMIATTVFNDLKEQTPNDMENIIDGCEGWLEGAPDRDITIDYQSEPEKWREEWDKYEKEIDAYTKDYAENFMKVRKKMFVYTFEYSDNDGDYSCTLEHGGIFDKLDHVRVSRH